MDHLGIQKFFYMGYCKSGPDVWGPELRALVSTVRGHELPDHNHRVEIVVGVREEECRALVQTFFKARR